MNEALSVELTAPDLRLVALHPTQLEDCRQQLIVWADRKSSSEGQAVREFTANFEAARVAGIKTDTILKHLNMAAKRQVYFSKIGDALKAGYHIIPNMPMDVFAIRRTGNAPGASITASWSHNRLPALAPMRLPAGEGEYRNPDRMESFRTTVVKGTDGSDKKNYITTSEGWQDELDFPFTLAKPEVLTATQQALALKLFDEIGVMPGRREQRSDPMVIGRFRKPGRAQDRNRDVSFLIAWFLDTDTL